MAMLVALLAAPMATVAQPEGIRGACGLFIEQKAHDPQSIEWVDQMQWAVTDNRDGTYSVGARYRANTPAGGRRLTYTVCLIRPIPGGFGLVRLSELR